MSEISSAAASNVSRRAFVALAALVALTPGCWGGNLTTDAAVERYPLILDTDAGADDLMALAFLLAAPGVEIEAVTVGLGLTKIEPGAHNVLRVLELAGRRDIPVYRGRATPLAGDRAIPDAWRALSYELPGVDLPTADRLPEARPAAEVLAERLSDAARPVGLAAVRRMNPNEPPPPPIGVAQVRPGMTPELLANLSAALHRQGIERMPVAIPFACPSNTGGR
jgi:hypothetical protein